MRIVDSPTVYMVAKTVLCDDGLQNYLEDIGSPKWTPDPQVSDGENLIEAAGRMCYRSWQTYDPDKPLATNPNLVTRVREGNADYIGNVVQQKHGSILEHVYVSFIFRDVSRVFTHELVRHRAGMGYSQESLRYVRLNDLSFWIPSLIQEKPEAVSLFKRVISYLEEAQNELADIFNIEDIKSFHMKKMLTSAFRRIAPIGLGTSIMATGNLRSWRHILEMRTSEAAEEEIRIVTDAVADYLLPAFPNVFQDMVKNEAGERVFGTSKV